MKKNRGKIQKAKETLEALDDPIYFSKVVAQQAEIHQKLFKQMEDEGNVSDKRLEELCEEYGVNYIYVKHSPVELIESLRWIVSENKDQLE